LGKPFPGKKGGEGGNSLFGGELDLILGRKVGVAIENGKSCAQIEC